MDDDVLRRGQPTVHVQFGQATALLCGDALQALAFEVLTPSEDMVPARIQARLCRLLSHAAGYSGMAGGQAIDLSSVGSLLSQTQLQDMHAKKTGALLHASVMMGAMCCGPEQPSLKIQSALSIYAQALGLAFQVVDDILDVVSDTKTLGKTVGKDAANSKPTFVSLMGLEGAKRYAHALHQEAHEALSGAGLVDVQALAALADLVIKRKS
jgi:farnesyl diphosphate synthase